MQIENDYDKEVYNGGCRGLIAMPQRNTAGHQAVSERVSVCATGHHQNSFCTQPLPSYAETFVIGPDTRGPMPFSLELLDFSRIIKRCRNSRIGSLATFHERRDAA